jgi:transcriptional regulator with XRE-family HTH domain
MPPETTDDQLQQILNEGLSQNEIARRTGIPRSTLRRRLKTLGTPQVDLGVPEEGVPYVHEGTQQPAQPTETEDDLQEMLAWWRERKRALQTESDTEQETQRQTYHVQKRYIAAIKRASDLERVSITEIVNRAFAQFFEQYFPEK